MSIKRLMQDLQDYQPLDINEEAYKRLILQFLRDGSQKHFVRENKEGHITGSAWVVNKERTHVLLVHHKKLNKWLQPGGHADGESVVQKAAKREAHEETGIEKLKPLSPLPFDVDVHEIPANSKKKEPAHLHYDIRYVFEGDMDAVLELQEDEVNEVRWFAFEDVFAFAEDGMKRMVAKTAKLV